MTLYLKEKILNSFLNHYISKIKKVTMTVIGEKTNKLFQIWFLGFFVKLSVLHF